MPPFPRPRFDFTYDVARERAALRAYRRDKPGRQIPAKAKDRLLIGTWNVANLGVQDRLDDDYALIAEVISWFDLVAVQEVNDDLRGILAIHEHLPSRYDLLFSDASGNRERQAFLYDSRKVKRLREVGRVAIPPSQLPRIARQGTTTPFTGFDRGPYLASFETGAFRFALLNVHLFFGSDAPEGITRLNGAAHPDESHQRQRAHGELHVHHAFLLVTTLGATEVAAARSLLAAMA